MMKRLLLASILTSAAFAAETPSSKEKTLSPAEIHENEMKVRIAEMKPTDDVAAVSLEYIQSIPTPEQLQPTRPLGLIIEAAKVAQSKPYDKEIEKKLFEFFSDNLKSSISKSQMSFKHAYLFQRLNDIDSVKPMKYRTRVNDSGIIEIDLEYYTIRGQINHKKDKKYFETTATSFKFMKVKDKWILADTSDFPEKYRKRF